MPLAPASRLGPYEILSALGAGGMGEVYKARDTRLDRTVAIKVLPSHLAGRPELKQRFEREAKAISSLTHPNICTLYDIGHEGDIDYLVMEHLEGQTLADKLTGGPLPPEQVVRYGIEIAAALDKAHRQGIVHRDLKPGNVMITRTGAKVLDFGLAKVAAGPAPESALDQLTSLPTQVAGTSPLTTEGTLLGTFQYMAPEQLEGAEADPRTDIFALGVLLYEMCAGRPAFHGKSRASLISAIMSSEPPPISTIAPLPPPALDRVIRTCLAKDPDDRIQTAHDVMLQLQWIAEGGSQTGIPAPVVARRKVREPIAWIVAGVALAAAIVLGALFARDRTRPAETVRLQMSYPAGLAQPGSPRLSPDGRFVAFDGADSSGRVFIWLRPLSAVTAEPIPATEGATARPFWSPDSKFIGFTAGGKLKKVSVSGGPAQTICDAPTGYDGSWGKNGDILFDGGGADPISRVSAAGGVAAGAVPADSGGAGWPHFLPDGRHFLYLVLKSSGNEMWVGDVRSSARKKLGVGGSRIEYSPAGYLLYVKDRTLLAQPFDLDGLRTTGEPMPVVDGVGTGSNGLAHFSVSNNGELVYSLVGGGTTQLTWVDRSGKLLGTVGPAGDIVNMTLAPDGKRVAVRIMDTQTGNRDIWVLDPDRGTNTRFTFDPGADNNPQWSPDGRQIAFSSDRNGGVPNLYTKDASGTGSEQLLYGSAAAKAPSSWSTDGRYLAYQAQDPLTGVDVLVLPMFGDKKPIPFLHSNFTEAQPRFSPDGKYIAYTCDESGRFEVYVQEFPGPGGKWQVSTRGGVQPRWRADGHELYYLTLDGKMMASTVDENGGFRAGVPAQLFDSHIQVIGVNSLFVVSADGQRFLLDAPQQLGGAVPLTVVLNWNAELKKR